MRKRLKKALHGSPKTYYPESFKIKVVKEVESGVMTKEQARRRYGIKGKSAVLNWCRKYGRYEHLGMKERIRDESEELKQLRAEKAALEAELEVSKLKAASLEALIEVADKMYSTDLKKKLGLKGHRK